MPHKWKFEKKLSASEALKFAGSHHDRNHVNSFIGDTKVELKFMGLVSCDKCKFYGCSNNNGPRYCNGCGSG